MTKDNVKRAYELAEKELNEHAVESIKIIVKKTLERVQAIDKDIDELQAEKKILKMDLDDLKEGRLDRIEERQKTDQKAKKVSIVEIVREVHHHHNNWWNDPYRVIWQTQPLPATNFPIVYGTTCNTDNSATFTINSSLAKNNVVGTYLLSNNHIVHLR